MKPMCLRVSFRFLAWQGLIFQNFPQGIFSLGTRVVSHKKLEFGLVLGPPMLGVRIPPVDGEKNFVFQGDLFGRDIN